MEKESKKNCKNLSKMESKKIENKQKNRYQNIVPCNKYKYYKKWKDDHSRVKLKIKNTESNDINSDYINADYIKVKNDWMK